MTGATDLRTLLESIEPSLSDEEYVFTTVDDAAQLDGLNALCVFRESEAITVICPKAHAVRAGLSFEGAYRHIPVAVHSSLEAVGFLAAMATALAEAGIPCNAVSAFYHDHLFVPSAQALRAVEVLRSLATEDTER